MEKKMTWQEEADAHYQATKDAVLHRSPDEKRRAPKAARKSGLVKKVRKVARMSDAEIFAQANRDRAAGLGRHMTSAMQEEQKRTWAAICKRDQIYDE